MSSEDIFKKKPETRLGEITKIELPKVLKDIFRIKTVEGNDTKYVFYNADGELVEYDY